MSKRIIPVDNDSHKKSGLPTDFGNTMKLHPPMKQYCHTWVNQAHSIQNEKEERHVSPLFTRNKASNWQAYFHL